MLSSYIDIDEIKAYGYQVSDAAAEGEGASDEQVLAKIMPRAARIFDLFAEVEPGYFSKAGDDPANRVFYGAGSDVLFLPPYIAPLADGAITMPTGYSVPEFYEKRDRFGVQYLERKYSNLVLSLMDPTNWPLRGNAPAREGWPCVPITISAKWGFDETPEDVKEAVVELTISIWRGKDPAFAKVIRLDDREIITQALPDRTKQIAAKYSARHAQEVGI